MLQVQGLFFRFIFIFFYMQVHEKDDFINLTIVLSSAVTRIWRLRVVKIIAVGHTTPIMYYFGLWPLGWPHKKKKNSLPIYRYITSSLSPQIIFAYLEP